MKKAFLTLIFALVAGAVGGYFFIQWKVEKSVDDVFASLFFIDANYGSVKVGLDGKLTLTNLDLFIKQAQKNVTIDSISFGTGSLLESIQLEKNLKAGKLPTALSVDVSNFKMALDRDLMQMLAMGYESDPLSEMFALGCGRHTSIGPVEFFDMGNRDVIFDFDMGYEFDPLADRFTSTFDFFLSGVGHIVVDQTFMGLAPVMNNFQSVMFGFDPNSITPIDMNVSYVDLGYNKKMQEYCATASGSEKDAWLTLNRAMFAASLDQFDFNSELDILQLYTDVISERSRVSISLRPLPGFNMADMQFYEVAQLVEMLDLRLIVNNESVDIGEVSWDPEKFAALNLSDLRREYRVGPKETVVESAQKAEQSPELERILKQVPVRDLDKYVFREVHIERFDGKVFTGEMTAVSSDRIIVRTRFRSGFTDLPLIRAQIKTAKLYPEN